MAQDRRLQIRMRFGEPKAGWLPVDVLLHGRPLSLAISYTPNDALLDFVDLLRAALEGSSGTCVWHCEPDEYEFRVTEAGDQIRLECKHWPDYRRTEGRSRMILTKTGRALDVCLPLWRSLRDLESRWRKPDFNQAWGRPFPSEAMSELSQQVQQLKAPPN